MRSLGHTVRDAVRTLRGAPGHSLFILLVLAVGIAAATVTYSVADAVMFRPLPFDRSDEIVVVGGRDAQSATSLTPEEFWAVHDRVAALDSVASLRSSDTTVTVRGATEDVAVMFTMADVFRVLRLKASVGRLWTADDEARGEADVAVIGSGLWHRRFSGDPAVVGESIQFFGKVYRIVGVLPPDAMFPARIRSSIEVWVPRVPARTSDPKTWGRQVYTLGRLKPGVPVARALAEFDGVIRPLVDPTLRNYAAWRPAIERWDEALVGSARGWLWLLLGAVTLIVLIACFNAANLMLTRSARRARELAVRASLGASRRRLSLALLTESLMLSSAATLCGLAAAIWGVRVVTAALPMALFRADKIAVNGRVLVAAMFAALVTGVIFGTVPAWQAGRVSVVTLLKDGGTAVTGARRAWRSVFLISEIACVGILLVVSTLFITSFIRVSTIDLGFERSNLIAVATVTDYQGTVDEVKARFARIPGVTGVAAVTYSSPPLIGAAFGGAWGNSPLRPVDQAAGAAVIDVELYRVSADYFDVAGIPFRRGSTWSSAGSPESTPIVIDEAAARTLFGEGNPLGQLVRAQDLDNRVLTVVGVVPFVFARGPEGSPRSSAYYAMPPNSKPRWVSFLVRTSPPAAALVPAVQDTFTSLAQPNLSSGSGVHVVDDGYRRLTAARRFNASLMTSFAFFAMLIGAAGIYAVMASIVAQQTREIGIRVALGATTGDIRRGVLAMAGRHVLIGLMVGLPVAWWTSRAFSALFFQVQPTDSSIYLIVTGLVVAVSLAGSLIPARRASRVDPMVCLRTS